jgi:hypothetical protein
LRGLARARCKPKFGARLFWQVATIHNKKIKKIQRQTIASSLIAEASCGASGRRSGARHSCRETRSEAQEAEWSGHLAVRRLRGLDRDVVARLEGLHREKRCEAEQHIFLFWANFLFLFSAKLSDKTRPNQVPLHKLVREGGGALPTDQPWHRGLAASQRGPYGATVWGRAGNTRKTDPHRTDRCPGPTGPRIPSESSVCLQSTVAFQSSVQNKATAAFS